MTTWRLGKQYAWLRLDGGAVIPFREDAGENFWDTLGKLIEDEDRDLQQLRIGPLSGSFGEAARFEPRHPLPIEYIEGEWLCGNPDPEPADTAACITYATEPSPETGHVGWVWWALGDMGESTSLIAAMKACEAVIEKKGLGL